LIFFQAVFLTYFWCCAGTGCFCPRAVVILAITDKICMMATRLACNRAIESTYWRMDNNSDVGLLMGYVLYRLPIELESMDLDSGCTLLCAQVDRTRYSSIASGNNCIVQLW
jgi:hypothetical protein